MCLKLDYKLDSITIDLHRIQRIKITLGSTLPLGLLERKYIDIQPQDEPILKNYKMFHLYSRYLEQKKLGRAKEDVRNCKKLKLFGAEIEVMWPQWSQLQDDLLRDIMSRLNFADQVHFRAVCKSWHDVDQYENAPSYSLPWLVSIAEIQSNELECRFYKSSNPSPLAVDKINLHKSGTIPYTLWTADTICKYGWLFFSIERQFENRASFLLFSLLTKEIIKLPCIVHAKKGCNNSSFLKSFSAEPSSPHCLFLAMDNYASFRSITIRTCSRGDKEWTTREFSLDSHTSFSSTPVYNQGIFYFLSIHGDMASYNVATEEWKVERYPIDNISFGNSLLPHGNYEVFELNGDLVLVYFFNSGKSGRIKRFDWCDKAWSPVKSLGDQALFVGRNSFLVSTVGRYTGQTRHIGFLILDALFTTCLKVIYITSDIAQELRTGTKLGITVGSQPFGLNLLVIL